ncbi:MAG: winged helix-turn-helix domain-containing protein [Oscillospiraceae bacterium]|nr:winged helix-turn-helix domain-containing protein [Oscillospiraceae bacterium]
MQPIIQTKLNPVIEILGLIYMSHNPKLQDKAHFVEQAAELGISGEELYKKYGGILSRYIAAFEKQMVTDEADSIFFTEADTQFLFFAQMLFAAMPEWLDRIESVPEAEISTELMEGVRGWMVDDLAEDATTNEIINALAQSELSPSVCWKFLRLIQQPKQQLTQLAQIIRKHLPAYESALLAVEKPLRKRMELFEKARRNGSHNRAQDLRRAFEQEEAPIHTVTPMLIHPALEIAIEGNSYVGLFIDDVFQMIDNLKKTHSSNPVLKAVGDSSKFDILVSLNRAPKYNLELAEHLGLSAATVSHHMQTLILHGLVSVEKRDGRVYYTLEKEPIREIIADLQAVFDI